MRLPSLTISVDLNGLNGFIAHTLAWKHHTGSSLQREQVVLGWQKTMIQVTFPNGVTLALQHDVICTSSTSDGLAVHRTYENAYCCRLRQAGLFCAYCTDSLHSMSKHWNWLAASKSGDGQSWTATFQSWQSKSTLKGDSCSIRENSSGFSQVSCAVHPRTLFGVPCIRPVNQVSRPGSGSRCYIYVLG